MLLQEQTRHTFPLVPVQSSLPPVLHPTQPRTRKPRMIHTRRTRDNPHTHEEPYLVSSLYSRYLGTRPPERGIATTDQIGGVGVGLWVVDVGVGVGGDRGDLADVLEGRRNLVVEDEGAGHP
jgi:hypothetical protein